MSWPSIRFGPHKIKIIKSIRSHSGGPLGTIPTAHSWELNTQIIQCTPTPEDFLALSFLPFTPGIGMFTPPASSAGPCWFLLSRCLGSFHVVIVHSNRTPRTLAIFSRGSCQFRLPRTIDSYRSVHSSRGLSPTDSWYFLSMLIDSLFTWSHADCIDYHRLLVIRFTWLDSHGLSAVAALALLCSPRSVVSLLIHSSHGVRATIIDRVELIELISKIVSFLV
jgi:hypothetical protein